MKKIVGYLALALGLFSAAEAAKANDIYRIRICRQPGISDIMDGKNISVPKGTMFIQVSQEKNPSIPYQLGYRVALVGPVVLGPKPGCADAETVVVDSTGRLPPLKNGDLLKCQAAIEGNLQARFLGKARG